MAILVLVFAAALTLIMWKYNDSEKSDDTGGGASLELITADNISEQDRLPRYAAFREGTDNPLSDVYGGDFFKWIDAIETDRTNGYLKTDAEISEEYKLLADTCFNEQETECLQALQAMYKTFDSSYQAELNGYTEELLGGQND